MIKRVEIPFFGQSRRLMNHDISSARLDPHREIVCADFLPTRFYGAERVAAKPVCDETERGVHP